MNLRDVIATIAVAVASLAYAGPSAKAQAPAGDLILSFRFSNNTNTNDLEVDLGSSSNFTTTAILNLTYGSDYYAGPRTGGLASSDLDTVFGTTSGGWNTLTNLAWDVASRFGTTQTNTRVFVTQPTSGSITPAAAGTALIPPGQRITTMLNGFQLSASAVSLTSPEAWAVAISPATQSEYTGALRNAAPTVNDDFGFFSVSTESGVTTIGSESMELYNYGPNTVADLGTFTLTSTGGFTFNGAANVPEPTAFGLLGTGVVGLVGLRRLRRI